jgi:hypothetical protein
MVNNECAFVASAWMVLHTRATRKSIMKYNYALIGALWQIIKTELELYRCGVFYMKYMSLEKCA